MADNDPGSWNEWADVPSGEQNVINSLLDQWRQASGFYGTVPDWAKMWAAKEGIGSVYQMGQYMDAHTNYNGGDSGAYFIPPGATAHAPWAAFGMTADAFQAQLKSYQATMEQYTGTGGDYADFTRFMQAGQGNISPQFMIETMLHDQNMLNTYGWLKYGLNYDQFQQQKQQMKQSFGFDLSNEEAVKQLEYFHTNASATQYASTKPTFTQEEKKAAYTGPTGAGAVVR